MYTLQSSDMMIRLPRCSLCNRSRALIRIFDRCVTTKTRMAAHWCVALGALFCALAESNGDVAVAETNLQSAEYREELMIAASACNLSKFIQLNPKKQLQKGVQKMKSFPSQAGRVAPAPEDECQTQGGDASIADASIAYDQDALAGKTWTCPGTGKTMPVEERVPYLRSNQLYVQTWKMAVARSVQAQGKKSFQEKIARICKATKLEMGKPSSTLNPMHFV